MKRVIAAQAKENQKAGGGAVRQKTAKPVNTRKQLAKIAGVSPDTISKVEKIESEASDEDKEKLQSGEITINAAYNKIKKKDASTSSETNESAEILQARGKTKLLCTTASTLVGLKDHIPEECKTSIGESLKNLEMAIGHSFTKENVS